MKKRDFTSKLNVKKVTIAKLDNEQMHQFVGGNDAKQQVTDVLCRRTLRPQDCIYVPTPPTRVGCCTYLNCPTPR